MTTPRTTLRSLALDLLVSLLVLATAGCPGTEPPAGDGGPDARPRDAGSCTTDAECDDGLFCDGEESCTGGVCVSGTPPDCADTVACTVDRCSEERSRCENVAPDADGDGYGMEGCAGGNDCDDDDALRYPGALEVCDDGGRDEDCEAATFGFRDVDGDGETSIECCNGANCGTDCNDTNGDARPGGTETCNGIDDDCNGAIDEGVAMMRYVDADRDGWGTGVASMGCAGTSGFAAETGDCDDTPRTGIARSPGQPEICDGVDNDCNDVVDDGTRPVTWYRDADGDGFGAAGSGTTDSCNVVSGYSLLSSDCDDGAAARSPGAAEICNAVDDDCNGALDYAVAPGDFEDDDRDGAPDMACGPPRGVDCDDGDPASLAGSAEICDGRDNDCDGRSDEGATTAVYYRDADGDGYGSDAGGAVVACAAPTGFSVRGGDCDDTNPVRSPRATDACNGGDDDCDGTADEASANATCAMLPGVADAACLGGGCVYGRCRDGHADCNESSSDGCEIDTDLDTRHCGGCDVTCGFFSESSDFTCSSGTCSVACRTGYSDCDGVVSNGCETLGATCSVCTGGMTRCLATCADLDTDPLHCGSCTTSCGAGGVCRGGTCDEVTRVAVGQGHSCALRSGGGVACWGDNGAGQLGVTGSPFGPATVSLAAPAIDLSCGSAHCCAALVDGRVECWGSNADRQLGADGSFPPGTHNVVAPPDAAIRVVSGYRHTVVVFASGNTYGWGDNNIGQLTGVGTGSVLPTTLPVSFADPDSVAAGNHYTCYGLRFGDPRCTGQIGGYFATSGTPHTMAREDPGYPDGTFAGAGGGLNHFCFVVGNGVWCAGSNGSGELGTAFASPPRLVRGGFPLLSRAVGASIGSTCVASATGTVWCSGDGSSGELGGLSTSITPVAIPTSLRARAISSGDTRHFCAVDLSGRAWCWGQNLYGESLPGGPPIVTPSLVWGL